jgi:hypothetical protein
MKEDLILEQPKKIELENKENEKEILLTEQPMGEMEIIQEQSEEEIEEKEQEKK